MLRVLVPLAAHIAEVTFVAGPHPIGGLETIDEELGRRSFGAYAMVPPGKATLGMAWVTPGMAVRALAEDCELVCLRQVDEPRWNLLAQRVANCLPLGREVGERVEISANVSQQSRPALQAPNL